MLPLTIPTLYVSEIVPAFVYCKALVCCNNLDEQASDGRTLVKIHVHSDKVWVIDAACIDCNKRFKTMRAVSTPRCEYHKSWDLR